MRPMLLLGILAFGTSGLATEVTQEMLQPGDYTRTLKVDDRDRSYLVHVPHNYDPKQPTPVVLVLHGAWTNGPITAVYSGLNRTADDKNFIAVYPNGTGMRDTVLFWNSGGRDRTTQMGRTPPDDVKFIGKVLDDLSSVTNVDPKRIYATGISNGGMMCYLLAGQMSDRIAAIAPIAGTLCQDDVHLKRPVSVLHFHGTEDKLVPYDGSNCTAKTMLRCKSVDETVQTFAKLDGCPDKPREEQLPSIADDGTSVKRFTYGPGKDGSEVVLIEIVGGGHNWPNRPILPVLQSTLGTVTHQINPNAMIWDFFEKHPMK
jgi:polyhydroxybutyrate depolymerase